jgi:hypothetical protein
MRIGGSSRPTVPKLYPSLTRERPPVDNSENSLYPTVPETDGIDQGRTPSLRESLTDKRLRSLKPAPAGQRYTIHDGRTGLAVRVTDKGERSWIVRPKLRTKFSSCDARHLSRNRARRGADARPGGSPGRSGWIRSSELQPRKTSVDSVPVGLRGRGTLMPFPSSIRPPRRPRGVPAARPGGLRIAYPLEGYLHGTCFWFVLAERCIDRRR